MGVARSSFCAEPEGKPGDGGIVAEFRAITDAFEGHGCRRVDAELRHRGFLVHAGKMRRSMREHDLNPRRRRLDRATDGDRDGPIHPFVARGFAVHGPHQLLVADPTRVAIAAGFASVAPNVGTRSRRVVGLAISRRIDARLAPSDRAAPAAAGPLLHSGRRPQYASELHRNLLRKHGFVGSMCRCGTPYEDPQAESPMKTPKVGPST
jgi:putative transposase